MLESTKIKLTMRILLVEDDTAQLEPLQTALSQAGHIVDGVEDGAIAKWVDIL